MGETSKLPERASLPLQPPEALQLFAFPESQLKVEVAPRIMVSGAAPKVRVGSGGGSGVAFTVTDFVVVAVIFPQLIV